jgi:hypothetical protein
MAPHTVALHKTLIRLAKSVIAAWEQWLDEAARGQSRA